MESASFDVVSMHSYIRYITTKDYPDIDKSIITSFLGMITSDEKYAVNAIELMHWNVIPIISSEHYAYDQYILQVFSNNKLLENTDYIIYSTWVSNSNYGGRNVNRYALTFISFKKCLMNTKDSIYKDQFILLESYVHHYNTQRVKLLMHINNTTNYTSSNMDLTFPILTIVFLILFLILLSQIKNILHCHI